MSTLQQPPSCTSVPTGKFLKLRGARTHNLKNIDLDLPLRCWISLIGPGGAGKTSLARDTILAEAHRRYLESLSLSTRQFLTRVERVDLDQLEGLPPCFAPGAQSLSLGPRATFSTALKLQELLATLFARLGTIHCPDCGTVIRPQSPQKAARNLAVFPSATKIQLAFQAHDLPRLQTAGFSRFIRLALTPQEQETDYCIVDRLILDNHPPAETLLRLEESITTCYAQNRDCCLVLSESPWPDPASEPISIDGTTWYPNLLTREPICARCGRESLLPEPALFLFRSPLGACRTCRGTGLSQPSTPRRPVTEQSVCSSCSGTRLRPEARSVRIEGTSIDELTSKNSSALQSWLTNLQNQLTPERLQSTARPIEELLHRIAILKRLGLESLQWNRSTPSLSTGERERLSVATLLANRTSHALYLLDEPTRGLHPLDRRKLIDALTDLIPRGNTLLIIDHDPLFIEKADWVVELGPGSGRQGGNILFSGLAKQFRESNLSNISSPLLDGKETSRP